MFDISKAQEALAAEDEGIAVEIRDNSGEVALCPDGSPVTITVVGSYSKRCGDAREALQKRMAALKVRKPSRAQSEQHQAWFVADCVLDWHGITDDGKPFVFTRDNAIDLFLRLPFVREQVEAAMVDHAAFFSKRSTN